MALPPKSGSDTELTIIASQDFASAHLTVLQKQLSRFYPPEDNILSEVLKYLESNQSAILSESYVSLFKSQITAGLNQAQSITAVSSSEPAIPAQSSLDSVQLSTLLSDAVSKIESGTLYGANILLGQASGYEISDNSDAILSRDAFQKNLFFITWKTIFKILKRNQTNWEEIAELIQESAQYAHTAVKVCIGLALLDVFPYDKSVFEILYPWILPFNSDLNNAKPESEISPAEIQADILREELLFNQIQQADWCNAVVVIQTLSNSKWRQAWFEMLFELTAKMKLWSEAYQITFKLSNQIQSVALDYIWSSNIYSKSLPSIVHLLDASCGSEHDSARKSLIDRLLSFKMFCSAIQFTSLIYSAEKQDAAWKEIVDHLFHIRDLQQSEEVIARIENKTIQDSCWDQYIQLYVKENGYSLLKSKASTTTKSRLKDRIELYRQQKKEEFLKNEQQAQQLCDMAVSAYKNRNYPECLDSIDEALQMFPRERHIRNFREMFIEKTTERYLDKFRRHYSGYQSASSTELQKITSITVPRDLSANYFFCLNYFPELQSIDFSSSEQITNAGLERLRGIKTLKAINLSGCKQISGFGMSYLRLLPLLETISVRSTSVSDRGLEFLSALTNLHTLHLDWCTRITDSGMNALTKIKSLQVLNLQWCERISDSGMKNLVNLPQLRVLDVSSNKHISNTGLLNLSGLRCLQSLTLQWCERITDDGLNYLGRLTELETLDLLGCKNITLDGLSSLAQLPKLKTLIIRECRRIDLDQSKQIRGLLPGCSVIF